jgi:hypothetical protein
MTGGKLPTACPPPENGHLSSTFRIWPEQLIQSYPHRFNHAGNALREAISTLTKSG